MELNYLLAGVLLLTSGVMGQQVQQQQPAEFRQLQEPVFTPPLPLPANNQNPQNNPHLNFQQFEQRQQLEQRQQFNQPQPQAQQQPQPQFNQQRPQQQPLPQQNFNRDVANFNQGGGETLPTLPPVFIPPNTPQGPPPQLQSPIRNLFRQPGGDSGFSFTRIINRFFNLFNLNNN